MAAATKIQPTIAGRIVSGTAINIILDDNTSHGTTPGTAAIIDNYERYTFAIGTSGDYITLTPTLVTNPAGVSAAGIAVNAVADIAFASDATIPPR